MLTMIPQFQWVPLEKIQASSAQPRQHFDEDKIRELAQSIAQHGILQPLLLNKQYQIIAGERRWRAAKMLSLLELPCMILSVEQHHHTLLSLLENIQREQMEPLEEALSYQRLQKEFSWTQEHIANLLGKSRTHVTNMLRLLKLSASVLSALEDQQITYGHARALIGLSEQQQQHFLGLIIEQGYSVRQIENIVQANKKKPTPTDSDITYFLKKMSEKAGTVVDYQSYPNGQGWLKFKFFNQDSLQGLLEKLGLSYDE